MEIADGQPFKLRAMRKVLEKAGDADFAFLEEAETGLPLGVKHALPRTPLRLRGRLSGLSRMTQRRFANWQGELSVGKGS